MDPVRAPFMIPEDSRAQAPTCWRSFFSRRQRAQEADGLCWQRGGLVDLEGMLLVDVLVKARRLTSSDVFAKGIAGDKVQETPRVKWPTFEMVLYPS